MALLGTLLLVSAGMWFLSQHASCHQQTCFDYLQLRFFIECITLGVQSFTANLDDYKKVVKLHVLKLMIS